MNLALYRMMIKIETIKTPEKIVQVRKSKIKMVEVPITSIDKSSCVKYVTQQEMHRISLKIRRQHYRLLGRELQLSDQTIDDIISYTATSMYGDEEIVYTLLRKWRETKGKSATRLVLKHALVQIGRTDLADEMFSDLPQNKVTDEMKLRYKGIQQQIEECQVEVYKDVQLPQVHWTDRILPLEELYVNLELITTAGDYERNKGEPIQLEELFNKINGKDPLRILIEGGPGYGKTTLGLKLLNDWGRNRSYIRSKFKMVFLFELRYFKENDSIEEMLKSECEVIGVNGTSGISCIEAFENETLLILDGFDELSDEGKRKLLPVIQKKKYFCMSVVVTSRRGMIEMGEKREKRERGILKRTLEDAKYFWNKKVLIKGVTTDKIEIFMRQYFDKDYNDFKLKVNSIINGEMKEVFECPLFLILLAMLLEEKTLENVKSKLSLYGEFFNFIIRRNLIRENKLSTEEEIDIFDQSSDYSALVESLDLFGRLAIEYLCENKLMFEEEEVLKNCNDKMVFHLGFLTKIPKLQGRRKENFYQPIHKSFLEFVAAFSMWNLFKTDEEQFKREIERIGNKGLKPTNDSLFYVFLGGFINSKAYVLFQCLTRYALWFNIESLCFTNILLEIKDIQSFFPSFQPILDLFIPSFYTIDDVKGFTSDYFQSEIHSLILRHSSDRQLIKILWLDSKFYFNVYHDLYFECLYLYLNSEVLKMQSNENVNSIKCKIIVCKFSNYFEIDKWGHFVSLFNSIPCEKINFFFGSEMNEINSLALNLVYNELIKGYWKEKNIERLRFELNEADDPRCLSLMVDLVTKKRITKGIHLWIKKSERRTDEENNFLKMEIENLFKAATQTGSLFELNIRNYETKSYADINFNSIVNTNFKSSYLQGSLNIFNSNENETEKYSFEEIRLPLFSDEMELNFIQNIQEITYLECKLNCFNTLVEMKWSGLNQIEELEFDIPYPEQLKLLNCISQLSKIEVLTLDVTNIKAVPSDSKLPFINLFSSLNLRICQFIYIHNLELFSFFIEAVMEGLNTKDKNANISVNESKEVNKFKLQELFINFNEMTVDFKEMKKCKGIQGIQSMLRNQQLRQCCWVDYNSYNVIKSHHVESLFPKNGKFQVFSEVNGMNPSSSRWCRYQYRWFLLFDRICIQFVDE